jgi:alanyl-tRNA synthetase
LPLYEKWCNDHQLPFSIHPSVLPPDPTTLFVTSGMQKHKPLFSDPTHTGQTLSDVQHCLRLKDMDEIGDGTHNLDFWMLGLFSFRHWSVRDTVLFWYGFLDSLGIPPDTVTIPPHRPDWYSLYEGLPVTILVDPGCVWSDGVIGGDCTEFYKDGVEIGNIVNPLGTCMDCGFGLERLEVCLDKISPPPTLFSNPTRPDILCRTIGVLVDDGVIPGNKEQGFVLRKLIRRQMLEQGPLPVHPLVLGEKDKVDRIRRSIPGILRRHPGKTPGFYRDTFGIEPEWLPSAREDFS